MAKHSALDTLIELTRTALDNAARLLASERRTQQQILQQLQVLQQYRMEYGQRMQEAMHAGIDPASLLNYRAFLASLDSAIERASRSMLSQQQKVDNSQRVWQEQRRKLNSYDTLVERRQQTALLEASRREQRISDELSARLRQNADPTAPSPDRSA